MDCSTLLVVFAAILVTASAWSRPFYPVHRAPLRVTRYAPPPMHRIPVPAREIKWERPKREHDYDHDHNDHDHIDHDHKNTNGVTGPVHTFVKTDKNANYKWGVRHHVGNKFAP